MSSLVTATVGSAIIGGIASDRAASKNNKISKRIADRQLQQQDDQYNQTREDYSPYMNAGTDALDQMENPNENFEKSFGYDFARSEGMRGIDNSFSGRGSGGNAMRALGEYTTGLAGQDYGNWWDRQYDTARLGANAVGGVATEGRSRANANTNTLGNLGQSQMNANDTRVSGVANALTTGIGNWQYGRGNKPSPYTPTQSDKQKYPTIWG